MNNNLSQVSSRYILAKGTLVLILARGRDSRLHKLTDKRAKPAFYFGGNHRIVDFALSNCINSGLSHIGVIARYAAHSLLRYLQRDWPFLPQERGEFIDMLSARQRIGDSAWYRGTADAVYQNMAIICDHYKPECILILAGNHICKQDYGQMLSDHVNSGARCTIDCIEVPRSEASEFEVIVINENLKVKDFVEKSEDPPPMAGEPDVSLTSMGIYIFGTDYLYEMLNKEVNTPYTSHDLGKDVLPGCLEGGTLYVHPFSCSCMGCNAEGDVYWHDVDTLDSFWQSNIDLVFEHPQLDIYNQSWSIQGNPIQSYPSKFFYRSANIKPVDNSLIGGDCVITNASISYSVSFDRVRINGGSNIDHSVVLPEVIIGKNCILRHCIIDRHCVVPDGIRIDVDKEPDRGHFRVSSSGKVVLITPAMLKRLEDENVPEEGHLD